MLLFFWVKQQFLLTISISFVAFLFNIPIFIYFSTKILLLVAVEEHLWFIEINTCLFCVYNFTFNRYITLLSSNKEI